VIRRIATGLVGVLLLWGCSEPDPYADHVWPSASPALWQVTTDRGEVGWLFGTVHALPDDVEWRSEAVEQAFAESELLVVEIANLRDTDAAAADFNQLAYSSGQPPLLQRIDDEERPALEALIDKAGASERDFHLMENWAAAMILSAAVRAGDPANGVDRALLASGKRNMGLESFGGQYLIFDSLPDAEQADLLLAIAGEAQRDNPLAATEAWLVGDLTAIETLGERGILTDPELREALINARNRTWVEKIVPPFEAGLKPFVAVGAAHMLGEEGLPSLLSARGWTVERLQ
jgi:uncharacterized protein YbaP (TraB family)